MEVELAAAAGSFPLYGRPKIVDVELGDLLWIVSGLDVDVPELHGHTRLLLPAGAPAAPAVAASQHKHRNSTDIRSASAACR